MWLSKKQDGHIGPPLRKTGLIVLFLYNILILSSLFLLSPFLLLKLLTEKRYRTGLSERLGNIPDDVISSLKDERPIWFHAASVGEVIASQRLLEGIRERWPDRKLLVSTFTPTGKETAKAKLQSAVTGMVDNVIFLPLDLPWVVNRVLKKVNPSVLILMETELWPNLISNAGKMGIPVVVVNGRISDRSYGKYWFISPLFRKVFDHINRFLMQSDADSQRIVTLGADQSRVSVTGNIKFDLKAVYKDIPFMDEWGGPLLIAGSTRKGEDAPILDIYKELKDKYPALKLIVAPRHIERVTEVEEILEEKGLGYVRRSQVKDHIGYSILLLDTLGELLSFYKYGDIVFVGGSLVPIGGHNLLEPALYGKPVLFGPHIENFRDAARIITDSGGGIKVKDADDLRDCLVRLLSDNNLCSSLGEKGRQAVLNNQGATQRTLDALSEYIK